MVKKQQMTTTPQMTTLDRFALYFEYDKPIQEIKRDVRNRTI